MIWHRIDETPPPKVADILLCAEWGFDGVPRERLYWADVQYKDGKYVMWPTTVRCPYPPTHWAHITPPEDGE